MPKRSYSLANLYDADLRTVDATARMLAERPIPHPLTNVQYADGISRCRHAKRHGQFDYCSQEVKG